MNVLYKIDGYGYGQKKWFRKFYGGEWNRVYFEELDLKAWVKGKPDPSLRHDRIIETEVYESER